MPTATGRLPVNGRVPKDGTRIFNGFGVGNITNSNKIISAADVQQDFQPGMTMWLIFNSTSIQNGGTETVLGCNSGNLPTGKGWWVTRAGGVGDLYLLSGGGSFNFVDFYAMPTHGVARLCIKWLLADSHVLVSANGSNFADKGECIYGNPVDSSCASAIGTDNGSFGGVHLTDGSVVAYAIWNREATQAEAKAGTFTDKNRFEFPFFVLGSPNTTVSFNAAKNWDGSSDHITMDGSLHTVLPVTGTPTHYKLDEKRIPVSQSYYHDGHIDILETTSGYDWSVRNSFGRLKLTTDSLHIGVEAFRTQQTIGGVGLGLFTNGTFLANYNLANTGVAELINLQPGAGSAKAIEIWSGPQNLIGITDERGAEEVQAVRIPLYLEDGTTLNNFSISQPGQVDHRVILKGDSILLGAIIAGLYDTDSITALLRQDLPTYGITCHAYGTASAYNEANTQLLADTNAAFIAAECDGLVSNTIIYTLMTNDYGFLGMTHTAYGLNLARDLDAIHAAAPNARIKLITAISRLSPGQTEAANGNGSTLAQFRTTAAAVGAARASYCDVIDGTTILPDPTVYDAGTNPTGDYNADDLHLSVQGNRDFANFIETLL